MSSLLSRIRNIWRLSELGVPEVDTSLYSEKIELYYPDMMTQSKKATFIPRVVKDPIKELTEEQP